MGVPVKHWTDHIAEVSSRPEYQTAVIRILDSSVKAVYDVKTDEYTFPDGEPTTIYEGPARIIFPRWGVFSGGEGQSNSKTNRTVRVQLAERHFPRIRRGMPFRVLEAPRNPSLVGQWGRVTSDSQGSSAASRTFEAALDSDND